MKATQPNVLSGIVGATPCKLGGRIQWAGYIILDSVCRIHSIHIHSRTCTHIHAPTHMHPLFYSHNVMLL